ncbi:MAG: alpha-galactosidase, partial [Opitutaceae bacterium]
IKLGCALCAGAFAVVLVLPLCGASDAGRVPIRALPQLGGWALETAGSTYLIAKHDHGGIQHVYFGPRLPAVEMLTPADFPAAFRFDPFDAKARSDRREVTNEEFPAWGGMRYEEPALKARFENGVRDAVLDYVSARVDGAELELVLKERHNDLFVTLLYQVFPAHGVISKAARIENRTAQAITLESAQSGVWQMPPDRSYRLTYAWGRRANEAQIVREMLQPGTKVIDGRRGLTGHEFNPWFMIDHRGTATEEHGRVWFGALGWSGNWRLAVERTPFGQVRVTGGFNSFDFDYLLKPGEELTTPSFYGGFTEGGFGEASRMLHRFQRTEIVPHGAAARLRPVWYNSWQVYQTNVTEQNQKELATKAAALGVELFLVDDGWFHLREKTDAGLGDWFVDRDKFPNGLKPLADHVNALGMDFGLWVEPEMVNPNSDVYRAHPDWIINFSDRPSSLGRGQLILNLARDEVKEYLFAALDTLVAGNNVRLFKWDMNRRFSEPGWPEVAPAEQKKLWVKYTLNLYEIIDRLRAKHPRLEIESCAGGGGRVDLGILKRVDQFWISDDTDALDRLRIQEGFTYAYSPQVLMGRVPPPNSTRPNTPLEFRFLVAMMGSLGLSLNLNQLTPAETERTRELVAFYKTIRATIQRGDLHRISSPRESNLTANQFVAPDGKQSVLFVLMGTRSFSNRPTEPILLRGLEPSAKYRLRALHSEKLMERADEVTGSYLAGHGLHFLFPLPDTDGTVVVLERVP